MTDTALRDRGSLTADEDEAIHYLYGSGDETIECWSAQWDAISNVNRVLTHCRRGHEFTPANIMLWRGKRWCRACGRLRQAAYELRKSCAKAV